MRCINDQVDEWAPNGTRNYAGMSSLTDTDAQEYAYVTSTHTFVKKTHVRLLRHVCLRSVQPPRTEENWRGGNNAGLHN